MIQHRNYALYLWRNDARLRPSTKLILYAIADRCTETDMCRVSAAELSRQVDVGLATVVQAIKQLSDIGILQRDSSDRMKATRYTMPLPNGFDYRENLHRNNTLINQEDSYDADY